MWCERSGCWSCQFGLDGQSRTETRICLSTKGVFESKYEEGKEEAETDWSRQKVGGYNVGKQMKIKPVRMEKV